MVFLATPLAIVWVASLVGEGKKVGQGAPGVSWIFLLFTVLIAWNYFVAPSKSSTDAIGYGMLVFLEILAAFGILAIAALQKPFQKGNDSDTQRDL